MTSSLDGRRALVVGASSGIGREVGVRLAQMGADVVFHGRRVALLDEAIKQAGHGYAVPAELTDPRACETLVADAVARLAGLDILVYAASASRIGLLRHTRAEQWATIFATNVVAPALVVRAALPHFSPGAFSAFISSESVGAPYHGLIPYGASKAALEEVVRGLRLEHPELRFGCIRVGQTIPTDFAREFDQTVAAELLPKWIAIGRIPKQAMNVEEVGRAIADSLATATNTPTIEMQDIVLRAPGGTFEGTVASMMSEIEDAHDAAAGTTS
jgi:NAD(P)-dependent dehydrogenase (short-subunit alcohol dehydrogenase family)